MLVILKYCLWILLAFNYAVLDLLTQLLDRYSKKKSINLLHVLHVYRIASYFRGTKFSRIAQCYF